MPSLLQLTSQHVVDKIKEGKVFDLLPEEFGSFTDTLTTLIEETKISNLLTEIQKFPIQNLKENN